MAPERDATADAGPQIREYADAVWRRRWLVLLLTLAGVAEESNEVDVLALEDALSKLAQLDPRQARLVELRFYGGMTMAESAHVLSISVPTAEREWRAARAFLQGELGDGRGRASP